MSKAVDALLLTLISLIHILFVLFIILTPFIGTKQLLLIHFVAVPFLFLHWITNNNVCALTTLEKFVRIKIKQKQTGDYTPISLFDATNASVNECFMCDVIEPIYDFKKKYPDRRLFIYSTTIILWCITCFRLYKMWKTEPNFWNFNTPIF